MVADDWRELVVSVRPPVGAVVWLQKARLLNSSSSGPPDPLGQRTALSSVFNVPGASGPLIVPPGTVVALW